MSRHIKKARDRMNDFEPKSSKCPICGRYFRKGCGHSVKKNVKLRIGR